MSNTDDTFDWWSISKIDRWLDSAVSDTYIHQPLAQDWARVGKVIEELGEVIRALIGFTGQNPRKGITHSRQEMLDELADTAITGILGMQHFTKDASETRQILQEKLKAIENRVPKPMSGWAGEGYMP
jgi:NTP pyrophosphatase (non-canonical NTP hydrolase)